MLNNNRMICPQCGVEMNHHCDKLVYTAESQPAPQADSTLGGIVQEFHTCPRCGRGGSRQA